MRQITARVSDQLVIALDQVAIRVGRTRAEVMRMAIYRFVKDPRLSVVDIPCHVPPAGPCVDAGAAPGTGSGTRPSADAGTGPGEGADTGTGLSAGAGTRTGADTEDGAVSPFTQTRPTPPWEREEKRYQQKIEWYKERNKRILAHFGDPRLEFASSLEEVRQILRSSSPEIPESGDDPVP
ncbi:MAG: hypothetical protein ACOC2V_03045 [Alkalispirochaeta sp.]